MIWPGCRGRARARWTGESCLALNGKSYVLSADMTVIADANGVHDIAGIMGGEHSAAPRNHRRAAGDRLFHAGGLPPLAAR